MVLTRSEIPRDASEVVSNRANDARSPINFGELVDYFRSRRNRLGIALLCFAALCAGIYWLLSTPEGAIGIPSSRADLGLEDSPATSLVDQSLVANRSPNIWVHVAGSVMSPGVYSVPAQSRVKDAVAAAGGVSGDANINAVNLAAELGDGDQVFIPSIGDSASTGTVSARTDQNSQAAKRPAGKVNLNKASVDELEALPGIGPSTAEKIVAFRKTNGAFRSVDELLRVDGIGRAKLAQIAPLATV